MSNISINYVINGVVREIFIDAILRINNQSVSEIPEHPLESGAKFTDHIYSNPDIFSMELFVSNHPIKQPLTNTDGVVGDYGDLFLGNTVARVFSSGDVRFNRVQSVLKDLIRIKENAYIVNVSTPDYFFQDLLLSEVALQQEQTDSAIINVTAKRLFFSEVQTVEAPEPKQERSKKKRSRGNKNIKQLDEEKDGGNTKKITSLAKQIFG